MNKTYYPTIERIVEYNLLILKFIKVKKADQTKLLNKAKLREVIEDCEGLEGDVHDKAVVLCKGIIQKHPFASGNRRTAFVVTKEFLRKNKARFGIKNEPRQARVMLGIRERYYEDNEIKEWLKNGKIKEFRR
jgi:prophage maintenance system killer protein